MLACALLFWINRKADMRENKIDKFIPSFSKFWFSPDGPGGRSAIKRLNEFIWEGPKYLSPLIDGTDTRSEITLVTDPEKLLQMQASLASLTTSAFGKQL